MGIFKLFKPNEIQQNSRLEFLGHPLQDHAIELLHNASWDELESLLAGLSSDEKHPMMAGLSHVATDMKQRPEVPESGTLTLLKGYILLIEAWLERTGKKADEVSEDQAMRFLAVLDHAEHVLEDYIRQVPACPLAYGQLFKVYMGQGASDDELFELFVRYMKASKGHLWAHIAMAYAQTRQWGGSHEALLTFCQNSAKQDVRNLPLIAYGHFQLWFFNYHFEEATREHDYFLQDAVRRELSSAYRAYREADISDYEKLLGLNYFAFCFSFAGEDALLKECLEQLGHSPLPSPWDMRYSKIGKGYQSLLKEVGL